MNEQHIVITGNPVDGYRYYGPYESHDAAVQAANGSLRLDIDWWIASLHTEE